MIFSSIKQNNIGLYPHQIDAKSDILSAWDAYDSIMLQMPTGTGKTFLFVSVIEDLLSYYKQINQTVHVLIVAHRIELIHQISSSLLKHHLRHGIIQGDHIQSWNNSVQVGSIQSILSDRNIEKIKNFGFDYIVIDEAHHSLAQSYRNLFSMFPSAKKLGVTATPWRMNHEPFPPLYSALVTTPQVSHFISNGRLSDYDYVSIKPTSEIQKMIEGMSVSSTGDYVNEELDRTFNIQGIRAKLYESYEKYAQGRKGIIYAINKKHASNIATLYSSKGVKAAAIDCDTPKDVRDRLVRDFKDGRLKVLVNVEIFTEGFDCPDASFIQLARPTKSLALYLQQVGRGLRVHKDKDKTIILDNVGLYNYFGLPSANRQWHRHFNGLEADESPSLFQQVQASRFRDVSLDEDDEAMVLVHSSDVNETKSSKKNLPIQNKFETVQESETGLYSIPKFFSMKTKSEIVLFLTRVYLHRHPETKYWEIDKMLIRQFNLDKHAVRSVVTVEDLDEFTLNDEDHLSLVNDVLWDSEDTYFILTNQFDECPISMVENYANQFALHIIPESLSSVKQIYPDFPSLITDEDIKDKIAAEYENFTLDSLAAKYKHPTNEIRNIVEDDTSYRVPRIDFSPDTINDVESFKEFTEGESEDVFVGFSFRHRSILWYEENQKLKELSSEDRKKYEDEKLARFNSRLSSNLVISHINALIKVFPDFKNKNDIFVYLMMVVDLYDSLENLEIAELVINIDDYVDSKYREATEKFTFGDSQNVNLDKAVIELDKTHLLTIIGKDQHYHYIMNDEFVFLMKDRMCRKLLAQTILILANHPCYMMNDPVHCNNVRISYGIERTVDRLKPTFNTLQYSKKLKNSRYLWILKHLEGMPYLLSSESILTNISLGNHSEVFELINELLKSSDFQKYCKTYGLPHKVDSSYCLNLYDGNDGTRKITYYVTKSKDGSICGCVARPCLRDVWLSILQKFEINRRTWIRYSKDEPDPSTPKVRRKLTEEEKSEKKKKEYEKAIKDYNNQIETLSPPYEGKVLQDKKGNYYCGDYLITKESMEKNGLHYFDSISVVKIGPILLSVSGYSKQVVQASKIM